MERMKTLSSENLVGKRFKINWYDSENGRKIWFMSNIKGSNDYSLDSHIVNGELFCFTVADEWFVNCEVGDSIAIRETKPRKMGYTIKRIN